jgi:Fic family protein
MDKKQFDPSMPGKLVPIAAQWGPDHAFIPDDLPPKWELPGELWPLLSDAKQQVGILEGLGRNLPNPAILLRPLGDREAIQSSRLEGTYASPKELLLFELDPRESKSERDPANDQREVLNYRRALNQGVASDLPLSLRLLKDLHQTLMTGVRGKDRAPGEFRRIPVGIGSGGRFIPPPPEQVLPGLERLERYFHVEKRSFDPLVDCFLVHYQFETIHPFIDGNGRVGRLLLAIMLQQHCRLSKPWLYMSEFFEAHRDEYVSHLFHVSARNDWAGWIEFCLRGTLQQARDTVSRCERLLAVRERFKKKLSQVGGSVRLAEIVDDFFHSPFVRIADLPKRLDITYPTAKADIERLVEAGILKELSITRPKTYYAPDVYNVAYEKLNEEDAP